MWQQAASAHCALKKDRDYIAKKNFEVVTPHEGISVPDRLKAKRTQLKPVVDCRAQAQPFSDPAEPGCIRKAARVIYLGRVYYPELIPSARSAYEARGRLR